MPIIDEERDVLVLRVVYDGPPFSGKTTTLRTLSQGLGVAIVTPEESNGRTLAFDWVDYTGGLFEGRQIRCQIVSVPGQSQLARRRRYLLESADAVVVVADTRRVEINATFGLLRELLVWSRGQDPPVGLVLQANKRDHPSAVPRDELHSGLASIAPIGLIETIATSGQGVREAFVFGVRLALDRVRALAEAGTLARGRPPIDTPEQLLGEVDRADRPLVSPPPPFEPHARPDEIPSLSFSIGHVDRRRRWDIEDEPTFTPDPSIASGLIWPPVDGRTLLDEASRQCTRPTRTAQGDWDTDGGTYRLHSARASLFDDIDGGRAALIRWARIHAAHASRLSVRRVLVLAEAGAGRHRLWQVVRREPTLEDRLGEAAMDAEPSQLAAELLAALTQLESARELLDHPRLRLPCTLRTIGHDCRRPPVYVGLVPEHVDDDEREPDDGAPSIEREFAAILRALAADRGDFEEIVRAVARAATIGGPRPGPQMLARLAHQLL